MCLVLTDHANIQFHISQNYLIKYRDKTSLPNNYSSVIREKWQNKCNSHIKKIIIIFFINLTDCLRSNFILLGNMMTKRTLSHVAALVIVTKLQSLVDASWRTARDSSSEQACEGKINKGWEDMLSCYNAGVQKTDIRYQHLLSIRLQIFFKNCLEGSLNVSKGNLI